MSLKRIYGGLWFLFEFSAISHGALPQTPGYLAT